MTNDYRIGNLVRDAKTHCLLRVMYLSEAVVSVTTIPDQANHPMPLSWEMEPIPLSILGEKLAGVGFYECDTSEFSYIRMVYQGKSLAIFERDVMPDLRFVHQLQNLFYILTGKELEITFP